MFPLISSSCLITAVRRQLLLQLVLVAAVDRCNVIDRQVPRRQPARRWQQLLLGLHQILLHARYNLPALPVVRRTVLKKSANGETSGREVEREGMKFVAKITAANDIGEFGGFTQTVIS